MGIKLLGIDVDGTLLRHDKTLNPADVEAIRRARAAGITITLATGRLAGSTLAIARQLELDAVLVCADGALLVSASTSEVVDRRAFGLADARRIVDVAREHGLGTFVFHDDAIHYDERASQHAHYAAGWTPNLEQHVSLLDAGCVSDRVLGMISFGPEQHVSRARDRLEQACPGAHAITFGANVDHVLKLLPAGVDKASGLARVAERLGLARTEVAAMGDWLNDVPMLEWAHRSFAMGQAVEPVRRAARQVLRATATEGGGVAEVVGLLLDEGG